MRTVILMALCCAAGLSSACTFASVEARKSGFYHVNGYSTDPAGTARTFSDNYVQETNAETYRDAVRSGQAYPYYGGQARNDFQYYYEGIAPPAPQQGHCPHYDAGEDRAQETANEAKEIAEDAQKKADVSIRALKRQREIERHNAR